jgi:hypothetical protein
MSAILLGEMNSFLGVLKSADFNVTTDQAIPINCSKYLIRRIVVTNTSLNLTLAIGGFYTGASKSGTIIVAASQVYTALTASTKYVDLTLAGAILSDILTSSTIYFSLTTAQGAAATGDIYVFGDPLP